MKKVLLLEIVIVSLLIFTALLISFIPTFYHLSIAPNTAVFPLIHNNHPDYYFYLSLMRQGYEGSWHVVSRFTPEKFTPQFVQTFFVALGHASRILSIDLPVMYTLARLILGFAVALSAYILTTFLYRRKIVHIAALFFVLFGSSFWLLKENQVHQFMTFWTWFDARERVTFIPHHLFGTFAIILSLIFLLNYLKSKKWRYLASACLAGVVGTFVNPISLGNLFFAIIIFIPLFLTANSKHLKGIGKETILPLFFFLGICAIPLFYLLTTVYTTFPWNTYNPTRGMLTFPISPKEYILGLGPVFIFALLGLKHIFGRRDFLPILILSWFIAPFIGIFILSKYLNLGNVYFLYAAHYIPVGIIGAVGFINSVDFAARKLKVKQPFILLLLLTILALYYAGSWYGSIKRETSRWTPNNYNIFLPKDFLSSFEALNEKSTPDCVVLSGQSLGDIIPAYTHCRTVTAHPVNTYNFAQKNEEVQTFFAQNNPDFASKLIKKYNISYILFVSDTARPDPVFIAELDVRLIYQNPRVSIFQINK